MGNLDNPGQRRGPGRPRKWASDADRARAYRQRKRDEFAEPQRLRERIRQFQSAMRRHKREVRRAMERATQAEAELVEVTARERKLVARLALAEATVAELQNRLTWLEDRDRAMTVFALPEAPSNTDVGPRLNRAQRRAFARRR